MTHVRFRTGLMLAGALAVFATYCARADDGVPSAADLKNPQWIADGKAKFIATCSYCHGAKGEAGKTRSFADHDDWDPQIIHDTIVAGRTAGANRMPAWGGSIPDPLIWKIVAYIKSLSAGSDGKSN